MLPVYRMSEGIENLGQNYSTFDTCKRLFEENKAVLIFIEGRCVNEWHLRPFKKGAARLAIDSWKNNIPLKILPVGINYSSFHFYGKNIFLNFGNIISKDEFLTINSNGKSINELNQKIKNELSKSVYEIDKDDYKKLADHFFIKNPFIKKIALFIPAIIGFIANAPLYLFFHLMIKKRADDHYDSIMTGLLFLFYPLYVLAITLLTFLISESWYSLLILALLPFTGWSYLQLKRQIPK